ncbi:MAG TPA: POTRA domain-containing protein [Terracidiphilus sp.]|nr:POTRA domain-containing protein [Terracidiphilus sp.]
MRRKPARKGGNCGVVPCSVLLACVLVFVPNAGPGAGVAGWAQTPQPAPPQPASEPFLQWDGLPVKRISFEGVSADRLAPLPDELAQAEGKPLKPENLRESLRQLYSTGLYETIQVEGSKIEGSPAQNGVALIFLGTPRIFIGSVGVDGAKGPTLNAQLQRASQLAAGTRFTQAKLSNALLQMRQTLTENGFYEPQITPVLTRHPDEQLVDIAFKVVSGPQARVGKVEVSGSPGMSVQEFRRYAHLKIGAHVDHDTGNRALAGVLKQYQKQERMEVELKIVSEQYDPTAKNVNFGFSANRGPVVKVLVQGANIDPDRIKHIIPIFEEGSVDEDLLNEGNRRLRDYYQRLGYFDAKVNHEQQSTGDQEVVIIFKVDLGPRRRVQSVSVSGNHYFNSATLKELLSVHAADSLDRHGSYSQTLVSNDVSALQGVYRNNGFSSVKITPETSTPETSAADSPAPKRVTAPGSGPSGKKPPPPAPGIAPLAVTYQIEEGPQLRLGAVQLDGNDHVDADKLTPLLNTTPGQLLSPQNLAGDRDALITEYMSRGFEQVSVDVAQQVETVDPSKVDVVFHITEGPQIFVRNVQLTGLHYTRPATAQRAITLHAGDPLNQTALLETQRNLYDLALFNEVDAAVENPNGGATRKTILLQAQEARRWALTYGLGFEAQTGTPQNNCAGATAGGVACNPNGKTGVSPRVLADLTRNNLFGREQSASLQGTYGLLEQKIDLLFQVPHFVGNRNFGITFTGGYANSQDVTTYVASRLEAGFRLTENFQTPGSWLSKANTFIYEYDFRRVKVAASSLQVFPGEIQELATAVRVAGPGMTWIRDTRDSPLDAHRGTYTSFQEFLSIKSLGAEAQFNRLDVSSSSYYGFDKNRFVLARNTRYGQVRAFGTGSSELIPLPERLYSGGPTSLRGFSFNGAGPRDPETGFPIGGAGALINSTELRLPPPTLPWFGNTVSFVIFHDMGNVFTNAGDIWASAIRFYQPNRDTCKVPTPAQVDSTGHIIPPSPSGPTNGPITSTGHQGICSFNYFTHAPGIGLRYHTPVGPIRLDFSYNLNTPIYPVNINYSVGFSAANPLGPYSQQHVGEANHFNFFFSLGQTF